MFRYKLLLLILLFILTASKASSPDHGTAELSLSPAKDPWVESMMHSMTLEQKIAQLIFVRANLDGVYLNEVDSLVKNTGVGGIVWFKSNPTELVRHTLRLQAASTIPLLVCLDAEYGPGMRIDSAWSFPRQMILGAVNDLSLIRETGKEIGRQCRELGVQLNFAPVVDINSNPDNPVINTRSFGENPEEVSLRGIAYMHGLQDAGVLATAKHFPGHGDTDKDSHKTLPIIRHSMDTIENIDILPFKKLQDAGVDAIMTAHLQVPAIEPDTSIPFTLSPSGVNGLLRKKMKFKGLIITDALEMKGVTLQFPPGEIELKALLAGNDVLLMPIDVQAAIDSIKTAVDKKIISEKIINTACRRVLLAKSKANIQAPIQRTSQEWDLELNSDYSKDLSYRIFREAITLVSDKNNLIPFDASPEKMYASLALNTSEKTDFQKTIEVYGPFDHYNLPISPEDYEMDGVIESLDNYSIVFVSLHQLSRWPQKGYGINEYNIKIIEELAKEHQVVLTVFGNPYAVNLLTGIENLSAIQIAYEESPESQKIAAQALAGAIPTAAKLPVSINTFPTGTGIRRDAKGLLQFAPASMAGVQGIVEEIVDSIAKAGIIARAYPSCQVLIARNGSIFYNKAFGFQTYDSIMPVTTSEIYDIASVTKVAATTLAIMKLYEDGKIDLDATLGDYLSELEGSNKASLLIRDVLTHQARLKPWIPFYEDLVKAASKGEVIFRTVPDSNYSVNVAMGRYMHKKYNDSLWLAIRNSDLLKMKDYAYSDLGFYYLMKIVEEQSGSSMRDFLSLEFYSPLGLAHTAYRPAESFCLNNILPTVEDTVFRKTLLKGDVHDPGAAMLGGIGGHAGLFSNATDLAVIMQLFLNGGEYGGKRYLKKKTVDEFTRQQFPLTHNRRGLGFDKPDLLNRINGPAAPSCSHRSYGHSGFTGTYIWADEENGLLYIFLSNRTWPLGGENKLAKMNIRTNILEAVYQHLN